MLKVQSVRFSYLNTLVINSLTFSLSKGKSMAIIGESGCGKSTLLKLIYGLHDVDEGQIFWDDIAVQGPKFHLIPGMPFMKYLAQDFDLMPFITVAENVGKYLSNFFPEEKQTRIAELLEIVEMTEYANVKAKLLSGGQMQRVALARVLALEPEVLLLDEPFSHIDNFRKNSLRRKLFSYLKQKNITCIVATHDSTDVLAFADEVLIVKDGNIIEKGYPKEIYNHPKNKYIASLFGDVNAIVINGINHLIYPHQLKVSEKSELKVNVIHSYFRGNHYLIEAMYENQSVFFENVMDIEMGKELYLEII
ncbi:ABC transporter ATP-binding protein [Flavobacterium celericrescens]|uniref:ABC transporter ATP-binding protein n=1 Tax=Flavobacterium celericrescens TaxID=2709780 RepID=A0ABX0IIK6_9FLAO|nr:ABC transporter ATP-binding protein [Flavobacterium celericrescens]NHM05116.1 ABC transporter ATP-binding protein [Flavobacterium celericrescens]